MQFTTVIFAMLAAVAMAAPAAEPVAVAAPVPAEQAAAFCTECKNGGQSCCSLTACYVYKC
jgi:hypothetical protein